MNTSPTSRSIFVSGGTSGLGLHCVENFLAKGFNVAFCARTTLDVEATLSRLRSQSHVQSKLVGFTADVRDLKTLDLIRENLEHDGFNVDVLICNAGVIGPIEKFNQQSYLEWRSAFEVNMFGTSNLILTFLPSMLARRWGRVLHLSGGGATAPVEGMSSYAASKAASVRFIETLAKEYLNTGVTFNSISPGFMKTRLLSQMIEAGSNRIGESLYRKSLQRFEGNFDFYQKPFNLIEFLIENQAERITGKLISAEWDDWKSWANHIDVLSNSDLYTLRRIIGRDRGVDWGDFA